MTELFVSTGTAINRNDKIIIYLFQIALFLTRRRLRGSKNKEKTKNYAPIDMNINKDLSIGNPSISNLLDPIILIIMPFQNFSAFAKFRLNEYERERRRREQADTMEGMRADVL